MCNKIPFILIILASSIPFLQVFSFQLTYEHLFSIFSLMDVVRIDDLATIINSIVLIKEFLSTVRVQASSTLKDALRHMLLDLHFILLIPLSSSLLYNGKRLRVYFAPCGIALGHVGRCLPVAERLKNMFNGDVDILFSTYLDGLLFVKKTGFPVKESPPLSFIENPDGSVNVKLTVERSGLDILPNFFKQMLHELKTMCNFSPDVVVADTRLSSILAARMLDIPSILLIHQLFVKVPSQSKVREQIKRLAEIMGMGTLSSLWSMASRILIPDFPEPYTIARDYIRIPRTFKKKVKLIGSIIPKRPEELPPREELRDKVLENKNSILVFAPISGTLLERTSLAKRLARIFSKIKGKRMEVVLSYGSPRSDRLLYKKGNVRIYGWLNNRFEMLKASDIVVSRGGHNTLSECMYYGKPMIIIPTPYHSEHESNARSVEKLGIAKVIEDDKLNVHTIEEALEELINDGSALRRCERIRADLSSLDPVGEIVEEIFNLL